MFNKKVIFFVIVALILFSGSAFAYVFFTPGGSGLLTKFALAKYSCSQDVDIEEINGTLAKGISYKNIDLIGSKCFPARSSLKIQRLDVNFNSLSLNGINAEIFNARLLFPDSDPIVFYGTFQNNQLNLNVHNRRLYVRDFLDLFADNKALKKISGVISSVDVDARGSLFGPELTGKLLIDNLSSNGFSLTDCQPDFKVVLKDIMSGPKPHGEIHFTKGKISGPKTAGIDLKPSKIIFSGDAMQPALNCKATAVVEGTKINIVLKGSFEKPELKLTSEPPMSEAKLMIMLATGKAWKGSEMALAEGKLSAGAAADFLDYFIFGGSANKLAQALGISEVSLKYDAQTKGIGIKKAITDRVDAGYAVEQSGTKDNSTISQKVSGEYKVTENVSVGAEKELKNNDDPDSTQDESNDKAYLKFKKEF